MTLKLSPNQPKRFTRPVARMLWHREIMTDQYQLPVFVTGWQEPDGTTYAVLQVGGKRGRATRLTQDQLREMTRTLLSVQTML